MTTKITMSCDGCNATAATSPIHKEFVSFNGRGYGFGRRIEPSIDDTVAPTGWIWSDPYTSCTYCPACWAKINDDEEAA